VQAEADRHGVHRRRLSGWDLHPGCQPGFTSATATATATATDLPERDLRPPRPVRTELRGRVRGQGGFLHNNLRWLSLLRAERRQLHGHSQGVQQPH